MKKRILPAAAILCAVILLSACTGGSAASGAVSGETAGVFFGQVSAVEGDSVTLALADEDFTSQPLGGPASGGAASTTDDAGAPMAGEDGQPADGETPPAMPQNGQEPPAMPQGGQSGIPLTGESVVFTVDDDTLITLDTGGEAQEGTSGDIVAGALLTVTLDGERAATVIVHAHAGAPAEQTSASLAGAWEIDGEAVEQDGGTYASEAADENAVLVSGGRRAHAFGRADQQKGRYHQ